MVFRQNEVSCLIAGWRQALVACLLEKKKAAKWSKQQQPNNHTCIGTLYSLHTEKIGEHIHLYTSNIHHHRLNIQILVSFHLESVCPDTTHLKKRDCVFIPMHITHNQKKTVCTSSAETCNSNHFYTQTKCGNPRTEYKPRFVIKLESTTLSFSSCTCLVYVINGFRRRSKHHVFIGTTRSSTESEKKRGSSASSISIIPKGESKWISYASTNIPLANYSGFWCFIGESQDVPCSPLSQAFFKSTLWTHTFSLSPESTLAVGKRLSSKHQKPSRPISSRHHFDNTCSAARCTHSMILLSMGFQQMPSLPFPSPIKKRQSQIRIAVPAELPTTKSLFRMFQYFTEGSTSWVDFLRCFFWCLGGLSGFPRKIPRKVTENTRGGERLPKWSCSGGKPKRLIGESQFITYSPEI